MDRPGHRVLVHADPRSEVARHEVVGTAVALRGEFRYVLVHAGFAISRVDPEEAARMLPGIAFAKTAYEAAFEADVLVVITEWHEFRGLDPRRIKQVMRQPRIVDLRNIFNPEEMRGLGFAYEGVGRPQPRN